VRGVPRLVAWCLLVVWFAWIHALQERLSVSEAFALATPDLGMVLFVGLLGVVKKSDVFMLAVIAAIGRKSFSIDPSLAILCGFLSLAWLASVLRHMIELSSPLWRAALTVFGACGLTLWLEVVRYARIGATLPQLDALLPLAFTSGLAALALGSFAIRLPGLTPLRQEDDPW
jgi:hypothetical protein